jgi:hypothetical protein
VLRKDIAASGEIGKNHSRPQDVHRSVITTLSGVKGPPRPSRLHAPHECSERSSDSLNQSREQILHSYHVSFVGPSDGPT